MEDHQSSPPSKRVCLKNDGCYEGSARWPGSNAVGWVLRPVLMRGRFLLMEKVDQPGEESSFAFHLRGAVTALTSPQPGVKQVPHRVAEHVEGVDDNRQAQPRPDRQPWRHLHVLAPFPAEHASPARNPGWADRIPGSSERPQPESPPRC